MENLLPKGTHLGFNYGGYEQRIAWAIDDTILSQSVINNNGSQALFPYTILEEGGSTGVIETSYSSSIRVFILTTLDGRVELTLEGSPEGANWFPLTGGSLTLLKSGSHSFCINPLKCPKIRLNVVSSQSDVGVAIIC
jgi:hypothetical protein